MVDIELRVSIASPPTAAAVEAAPSTATRLAARATPLPKDDSPLRADRSRASNACELSVRDADSLLIVANQFPFAPLARFCLRNALCAVA